MAEKKLYKSANKMICGVCGGIAECFNADPTLIRLIVVFLVFAGVGSGLIAYIIAAIIMPDTPVNKTEEPIEKEAEKL